MTSAASQSIQKAFFLQPGSRETPLTTDLFLRYILFHIGLFHQNGLANHYRRGHRQVEGKVIVCEILFLWFLPHFHVDLVCITQPGNHLLKMFSGFAF